MSGEAERPSWGFLGAARPDRRRPDLRRHRDRPGVGERGAAGRSSSPLAAGSILYVVIQLARRLPALRDAACSSRWMILARDRARLRHRLRPRRRRRLTTLTVPWAPGRLLPCGRGLLRPPRAVSAGTALGLALALHVVKLVFRARAWRNILRASYPREPLKLRSASRRVRRRRRRQLGRRRRAAATSSSSTWSSTAIPEATYPTLAPTLVVETMFDFVVAGALMIWALSIGVLPTHQVYSRIPTVDWKFFLRHEHATAIGLACSGPARVIVLRRLRARAGRDFRARVGRGFAILPTAARFALGVLAAAGALVGLPDRVVYFFLRAFDVHASLHNALLAQVVDSLATLFPATPGGAGTKQGLIVYLFRGAGDLASRCCSRSASA